MSDLDGEILRVIERWHTRGQSLDEHEFDDLALRVFDYQLRHNHPYARFCASAGISPQRMPSSWREIPPVPSSAFKETTLATFDVSHAALAFVTSGTTRGTGGRHYMETRALYEAALLAGFDRFMLADRARLRYLNLVPNPHDRPDSSLGYMMGCVSASRGDAHTGWYLRGDDFFFDAFVADVHAALDDAQPVCIAATAFALVHLLDAMRERDLRVALPAGSRIMETGGFKGRARIVDRDTLYADLSDRLGVAPAMIVAEYGMTELTSQYYDDVAAGRVKVSPPWLRPRVVGLDGADVPHGVVGALVHVDCANRSSCVAILTEDLGAIVDGGVILLGREQGAALRGCSLDAEMLRARA